MRASSRHSRDRSQRRARLFLAFGSLLAVLDSCSSETRLPSSDASVDGDDAGIVGPKEDGGADPHDGATLPDVVGPTTYANPIFAGDFPDPFVLRDGARYYAFSTNAAGKNVRVVTSDNLAMWGELPDALPNLPSWAKSNASLTWAPGVLKRGNKWILYFTARDIASGFQCIGRAVATSPAGPYVDDSGAPFICQVDGAQALCGSIDASPFLDENGDAYLLWKSDENASDCGGDARLWTQRLGVDGISLLATPTELLRRDRSWEMPLIEGPSMIKRDNRYWLFYSANWWESSSYGIGYAECASPVGPCTKKTIDGPLVKSVGQTLGPGGQEFFTDPHGKTWMAYHGWSSPVVGYPNGGTRSLRIDPIEFIDGVPSIAGPSTTPRPL
jgi:beta-xylosidase